MALTPRQVKLLHIAKSKTRMDDDTYRALLGRYGASSSKDPHLQPAHYHEMMDLFAGLGFVPGPRAATAAGGTRAQMAQIERLCAQYQVDDRRLQGIVKRVTGRDALKWCGRKDLSKVIQALKRWNWEPSVQRGGQDHGG